MSWPLVELGSLEGQKGDFVDGPFGSNLKATEYVESGVPIIQLKNIKPNKYIPKNLKFIPQEKADELSRHSYVPGDVVIAKLGAVGTACIIPKSSPPGIIVADVVRFRGDQKKIYHRYLCHFMNSSEGQRAVERLSRGSTRVRTNLSDLKKVEIPLPPLPEQKRIAAILDKADAIRRKRQQAIQLADDFLRALFLDMFGDPVTNPKGWEVRPLSDLVSKLGDGLHGTPEYDESGDYYFINGNNLDSGSIVVSDRVKRVGDEEFKRHKKELTKNTMLVSINGTIGKVAFYQGERVVLGKSVCYFNVIPERISSMYLYHLIGSHYFLRYTGGIETGSTIKNVSLKSMREFPVPVPSANLQSRFEILVKRIESKKAKLFAGHNSAGALFDSLSQNAFSGQL